MCVFGLAFAALRFSFYVFSFFFFFFNAFSPSQAATVHVLYMNSSHNIWPVLREQYIYALFTSPQISFFINFFIKNGSHGTIYTFKNYFTTVMSVINFQFQQNKSYPNRRLGNNYSKYIYIYIYIHTHKGVLLLLAQNDKLLKPVKSWFLCKDYGFVPDVLHGEKFTLFLFMIWIKFSLHGMVLIVKKSYYLRLLFTV